jgi:hypothetical protein
MRPIELGPLSRRTIDETRGATVCGRLRRLEAAEGALLGEFSFSGIVIWNPMVIRALLRKEVVERITAWGKRRQRQNGNRIGTCR